MKKNQALAVSMALAVALAAISGIIVNALTANPVPHQASGQTSNSLTVIGSGELKFQPDRSQILLGIVSDGSSASDAAVANTKIVGEVIKKLNNMGISNDSIVILSYSISQPNFIYGARDSKSFPPFIGRYTVQRELQVTVYDGNIDHLGLLVGQAIDAAVSAGANQLLGVQFTVSEQTLRDLKQQALQKAVADAAVKARTIADSLGVKLGKVQAVSESCGFFPLPLLSGASPSGEEPAKGGIFRPFPILPRAFSISACVQVTYSLE